MIIKVGHTYLSRGAMDQANGEPWLAHFQMGPAIQITNMQPWVSFSTFY